jgi:hypothetical protein
MGFRRFLEQLWGTVVLCDLCKEDGGGEMSCPWWHLPERQRGQTKGKGYLLIDAHKWGHNGHSGNVSA